MRRLVQFAFAVLAGMLLTAVVYVGLVLWSGRGYCTERGFVPSMLAYKLDRLARSRSPRLIILSGSNAQTCINCDELAERLQMDVVCAGVMHHIPLRFYPAMLKENIGPGDVLYLPLEPSHYARARKDVLTPFSVSVIWGLLPEAQWTLQPDELLRLYATKGLGWLQTVLPLLGTVKMPDVADIRSRIESGTYWLWRFRPLPRGDFLSQLDATFDPNSLSEVPGTCTDEFRASLDAIVRYAEARGARVVLGNVVCYAYPREPHLAEFRRLQKSLGLPVCGNLASICLPYGCFADGTLHCNEAGKRLFTREIADELCRLLGKPVPDRAGWPMVNFPSAGEGQLRFAQADGCVGKPVLAEFIVDRGEAPQSRGVSKVLVNGEAVRFEEQSHVGRNVVCVWWRSPERIVSVELVPQPGRICRAERVLMEPDFSQMVSSVRGFNDVSSELQTSADNPKKFVCAKPNAGECHLCVRLRGWRSNRYILHLSLRGGDASRKAKVGGAGAYRRDLQAWEISPKGIDVNIALNESDFFVDANGDAVAGVYFPAGSLRRGEEIVLENLAFERR